LVKVVFALSKAYLANRGFPLAGLVRCGSVESKRSPVNVHSRCVIADGYFTLESRPLR